MAKQGEIEYLKNLGPEGRAHALGKPFSDVNCGLCLMDLGGVMSVIPQPPAKVLDLGAGTGWTSVFFSQRGYDVVGQDIAPEMIELANRNRERTGLANLRFIASDYEALDFRGEFDVAIFYDSLHHAEDEAKAIQSAFDALKPGGVLVTVEPGEGHANAENSLAASTKYGVTEKDMPPSLIVAIGKKIGFRDYEIYERLMGPKRLHPKQEQGFLKKLYRYLGMARTMVRQVMKMRKSRYMRRTNIVVLYK